MIAADHLQDSGPADSRLLTRLLQAGTLLIDEEDCLRFASAGACELMGVPDFDALRERWHDLAAQLRIDRWPRTLPDMQVFHGRADLATSSGPRAIRYEMHALDDHGRVHRAILVRDRARLLPGDRGLLLASEAQANRQVLTGLVHAAKGPLNNFNLTLAVLDAGIEPFDAFRQAAAACARLRRHLGMLRSEATALVSTLEELRALADRRPRDPARVDLAQSVRDVARWLRHEAIVREAAITADAPSPAWIVADREAVTLALVALASRLLDSCGPGSVVRLSAEDVARERNCIVRITVEPVTAPASFADELFAIRPSPQDPAPATARTILEAHGGSLSFQCDPQRCAVVVTLPTP